MLRSERMELLTVLAGKEILPRLIHVLHSLSRVQLVAIVPQDTAFIRGAGPCAYFPAERYMVVVRSLKEYLQLSPPAAPEPMDESELVLTLPERIEELSEAVGSRRARIEALAQDRQSIVRDMQPLQPLSGLPISLELLGGYENLEVVVAGVERGTLGAEYGFPVAEMGSDPGGKKNVRVFVAPRSEGEALRRMLREAGAAIMDLPADLPGATAAGEMERLAARLVAIGAEFRVLREELSSIAEENRAFLYAAEEILTGLFEKSRGATCCAVSEYAMAVRFWVPERDTEAVERKLRAAFPGAVQIRAEEKREELIEHPEEEAPPTRLRNPRWARPFEGLVEVFGVPSSREVDPTSIMALVFPLFFGFIVADAGYGAIVALLGLALRRKLSPASKGARDLALCLTLGGIAAILFGALVFGDAFGVPFRGEEGVVFCWGEVFPFLPASLLSKTHSDGVTQMLLLSLLAGWAYMTLGCLLGVVNGWLHHSFRHALARIGQLSVIGGMALLILSLGTFRETPLGAALWRSVLWPAEAAGIGDTVKTLLLAGVALTVAGEGPSALVEFFGLFANLVSFTRLALVGVSKAAVAIALNSMLLPALLGGGSLVKAGLLIVALTAGHLVLVLLGALTASVQSVRLHYYELFSKFFGGDGVKFVPFGIPRLYTRA